MADRPVRQDLAPARFLLAPLERFLQIESASGIVLVAAAIAALDLIESDPDLTARPVQKAKAFTRLTNLPEAQSPIVPVIVGAEDKALAASRLLAEEGFHVAPIRPPTVPTGTSRLRFTFTAGHPDREIERLASLVRSHVLMH